MLLISIIQNFKVQKYTLYLKKKYGHLITAGGTVKVAKILAFAVFL